mgnify:CR=1 FL=1
MNEKELLINLVGLMESQQTLFDIQLRAIDHLESYLKKDNKCDKITQGYIDLLKRNVSSLKSEEEVVEFLMEKYN